ncbi:hypothetical protein CU097_013290 [Rhizopus azygosporus]|uniref:DNA polymerase n=1 Tax=Rhizopus azygosporus TaxID=86630 RepID=A0A367KAF7_RHIAZ|nr:hypothetical protein CU097_013290 [Rhizopus azygosporus]
MSHLFNNILAFIIPIKLSDYDLSLYANLIRRHDPDSGCGMDTNMKMEKSVYFSIAKRRHVHVYIVDHSLAPGFINTKYACFRPTPYEPQFNRKLISLLLLIEKKRELAGEDVRSLSYRQAIAALKAYPHQIRSVREAEKIVGIGAKMKENIRQFLLTGTIEEAEELRYNEEFRTMKLFSNVFGVGAVTAKTWWDKGYRTLQQVLDYAKLTSTVRLGIQLFPHFHQLMNRTDVEEMIDIVKGELAQIDTDGIVTPVGGYRRGKPENADIDLIISTHTQSADGLIKKLTERLRQQGLLKHIVSHSGKTVKHSFRAEPTLKNNLNDLELCICAILQPSKGILRQVDLVLAEPGQYVTAVLGWTGSRYYERTLRDFSKKEKSININCQSVTLEDGVKRKKIYVESEEELYSILGVPHLDPTLRNC